MARRLMGGVGEAAQEIEYHPGCARHRQAGADPERSGVVIPHRGVSRWKGRIEVQCRAEQVQLRQRESQY